MEHLTLEQRVARLFDPPAPAVRGGVEAEGALPHPAESELAISAWVETRHAGVRLELQAGGRLRIVAYDPTSGQEQPMLEQSLETLVRETLRQKDGTR